VKTHQPCICITGPTACGKTELAIRLAKQLPLEIISMDSAMVYRGMNIGTAKPSLNLREQIPHHLIDIIEPTEIYSAGRFTTDVREVLAGIQERDHFPLLVGGTLLYLRALRDGLAELPAANAKIRKRLDEEAEEYGWVALHERLKTVDPIAAQKISPTDRQRIQRALEVYELTGEPITLLHKRQNAQSGMPVRTLALIPESRTKLAERIEHRFDEMVAAGLTEEIKGLRARGDIKSTTPAMRAVGYRQIWSFLDGEYDWEQARAKVIAATRQLAKRQMTWLRADSNIECLPTQRNRAIKAVRDAFHKVMR
jgi:tRNA dimethylallyltransferase